MEWMELLEAEDVEGFNSRRPDGGKLDLFAADLAEKKLVGVDLSRAHCDKSDLTGADLSDATLLGTRCSGIDGSGMKLVHVLAIKSRWRGAWLDEADLSEGDFTRANFTEAVLEGSVGTGVVLAGARLVEANARRVRWPDANLVEAVLHKADFGGADLRRADLSEASGTEVVLEGATLDGALAAHVRLQGARMAGASLVGARMIGANLAGADLSGADLSLADLTGANLAGATLAGARLNGAVLADAVLDGVDLAGLDLGEVDLSGVDPTPLGLSEAQRAQVAAIGVEVPEDAPIRAERAQAASVGGVTAVIWENEDGEEARSLRYALFGGGEPVRGVLPVPADKALARTIGPDGDGFRVAVLRERPGGVALVCYRLESDGRLSGATSNPLGYEPMVWPVLREQGGPVLYGLARRGPTLVVHRPDEEGMGVVRSDRVPTARGFLGKHHPVIACKGGVIQAAGPGGAGAPRRTPEGFPGPLGTAAPAGDRLLCLWLVPRAGEAAGGLRFAWLEARGAPEPELLTTTDGVLAVDLLGQGERCWAAWVELGAEGSRAFCCRLPDGSIEPLAPEVEALRCTWAPGSAEGRPAAVITTPGGGLVVVEPGGAVRPLIG